MNIHVHIALYNVMSLHVVYKCLHCTYMYKLTIIISIVPVCSPGYLSSGESPFCHHSPSTRPSWNIMPIWDCMIITYSQKIWRGIKFGGLAFCLCNCKIKIHQYFILAYIIRMAIPYQTAKFKSTNIFAMVIWGPTAKFILLPIFWAIEIILCIYTIIARLHVYSSTLCISL